MKFINLLLCLFLVISLMAQTDLRIGDWESHLPYKEANWVTQSQDFVYISTGTAVLKLDKQAVQRREEIEPEIFTKIDGLTETLIDRLYYDKFNNQLIVIYKSSNIDIVAGDQIYNLPFIKENSNIIGSRKINDVFIADENNAYLACAFGMINLQLKRREFSYTTFTPAPVLSVAADAIDIYMGLQDGLYSVDKQSEQALDFLEWTLYDNSSLPSMKSIDHLEIYRDTLYAVVSNTLYKSLGNTFEVQPIEIPTGFRIKYTSADNKHLLVGLKNDLTRRAELRGIDPQGSLKKGGADCSFEVIYGIEDQFGEIWYADIFTGIRHTEAIEYGCRIDEFGGPFDESCSQIEVDGDKVFFASGGASDNFAFLSNRSGIYHLQNNIWNNINESRYPIINQKTFLNFVSVAPHPSKNVVYAASYYSGVMAYDYDTEAITFYEKGPDTKIQGVTAADDRGRVAFVLFDEDENLWMTNFASPQPIVVLTKEGNWHNFTIPISNTNLAKMVIDQRGYIWFTVVGNNGGVLVYDKGERLADPSDDRYKFYTTTNSELKSTLINSLTLDLSGDIWVGTGQGPVIFDCDPFDDRCKGSTRKVLQDGIPAILLATEEVQCIEVDGGNRKWIGSKNGIFVQSSNGETEEARYTELNSPLLSNTIIDMDYDEKSGRMYISTEVGVQSLITDTKGAKPTHSPAKVYAYPNPVKANYSGPIAIQGLGRDANVKITDINGRLVYETTALGGLATWDGTDYNGRKAASGIYLVFSTSKVSFDTPDSYVTKILKF